MLGRPTIDLLKQVHAVRYGWKIYFDEDFYKAQFPHYTSGLLGFFYLCFNARKFVEHACPYFDRHYYQEYLSDQDESSNFGNYILTGWKNGRNPCALFDVNWYIRTNADVREAGIEPLSHYLTHGWQEGRNPNPYFDVKWYLKAYPDVKTEPLKHYMHSGWREGRNPSPYFDAKWYLECNRDVYFAGIEPLAHYIQNGWREGRSPNRYFSVSDYKTLNPAFEDHSDPLLRYISAGWKLGEKPCIYFDPAWYFSAYRDVAGRDEEPLIHYLSHGHKEGRFPNPYFDPRFYLSNNSDVATENFEPLLHFIQFGEPELRDPCEFFSSDWYADKYISREQPPSHLPPLAHYILRANKVVDAPGPRFDPAYYLKQHPELVDTLEAPLAHFNRIGRLVGASPAATESDRYSNQLHQWKKRNALGPNRIAVLSNTLNCHFTQKGSLIDRDVDFFMSAARDSKVISFDIFDTLVERTCISPLTVFRILEELAVEHGLPAAGFVGLRQKAELDARKSAGKREVLLTEIYDKLAFLSPTLGLHCDELRKMEIELEIRYACSKQIGSELIRIARLLKKTIILVSDIYLSEIDVRAILSHCGIGDFDQLFVSSELGASKHYGDMFDLILRSMAIAPHDLLHIGDNEHSDVAVPRSKGIVALHLSKTEAKYSRDPAAKWLRTLEQGGDVRNCLIAGHALRLASTYDSFDADTRLRGLGARYLGPLLLIAAHFFAREAKRFGHREIFFASRDTFYIMEAYKRLQRYSPDIPTPHYFVSSRKIVRGALMRTLDEIFGVAAIDHVPTSVGNLLTSRFLFEPGDLSRLSKMIKKCDFDQGEASIVNRSANDLRLKQLLTSLQDEIIGRSKELREQYQRYLGGIGMSGSRICIGDIGYRGSTQTAVKDLTGAQVDGIYMITWPEICDLLKRGLRYKSLMTWNGVADSFLTKHIQLTELLLSATHGSATGFSTGQVASPDIQSSDLTQKTLRTLRIFRDGALQFVADTMEREPLLRTPRELDGSGAYEIFTAALDDPPFELVEGLSQHVFEDAFGGAIRPLIDLCSNVMGEGRSGTDVWHAGTTVAIEARLSRKQEALGSHPEYTDSFDGTDTMPAKAFEM